MAKKRFKISVILCWVLVGLIFVMNVIHFFLYKKIYSRKLCYGLYSDYQRIFTGNRK